MTGLREILFKLNSHLYDYPLLQLKQDCLESSRHPLSERLFDFARRKHTDLRQVAALYFELLELFDD